MLFEIIDHLGSLVNSEVGRAVAPLRPARGGEESPSRTAGPQCDMLHWGPQGTVVANGHREQYQGKCHRKHTADGPQGLRQW